MTFEVGSPLPPLEFKVSNKETLSLESLRGQFVVLYFYPKDDTPACTTQAKDFTSMLSEFQEANALVIGISKDSLASHSKFTKKHGLTHKLCSDHEGEICETFGVWTEKSMFGKTYMGIKRTTFLINPDGEVAHIWRDVVAKGHAEAVLDTILKYPSAQEAPTM